MEFIWQVTGEKDQLIKVRTFLKNKGVSHRMFSKIKHFGGAILVNDKEVYTSDFMKAGDEIKMIMPAEESNELVVPDYKPLDIVYEDEHWLAVNKPYGVTTVPGHADRLHTLVNQVKGHLDVIEAENQVPHVVTRLDRDTSGIVLLAKHRFAHAIMDDQLQNHQVEKFYQAYVTGILPEEHGVIEAPIGRVEGDFIQREVRADGKPSKTEYWVKKRYELPDGKQMTKVKIQLHTGRTHQIRVHFKHLGHPLVGDDLYGGDMRFGISRQALNAYYMRFFDVFAGENGEYRELRADLPEDLQVLNNYDK